MKNLKMLGALAAIVIVAAAIPAEAGCANARTFSSYYIYTPGGPAEGVTPNVQGSFWVIGDGNTGLAVGADNGSWQPRQASIAYGPGYYYGTDAGWLYIYPNYPANIVDGLSGSWANVSATLFSDGCPDSASPAGNLCMAAVLTDQVAGQGYFLLMTSAANAQLNYPAFNGGAAMTLAPIPAPKILGSDNTSASSVTLSMGALVGTCDVGGACTNSPGTACTLDSECQPSGYYLDANCNDAIAAYRIVAQILPDGSTPPTDRDGGDWTVDLSGPVAPTSGVDIVANCSGDQDIYLATVIEFDSGFQTTQVSSNSSRVECGTNFTDIQERPRIRPGTELEIKSRGGKQGRGR